MSGHAIISPLLLANLLMNNGAGLRRINEARAQAAEPEEATVAPPRQPESRQVRRARERREMKAYRT